jgi:predicted Zn finger-like uncharacterized protein
MLNLNQSGGEKTMATSFVISCPDCAKQVKVSDEHVGKRVKCKGCGQVFPVAAPAGAKPKSPPPPAKPKSPPPSAPKTQAAEPEPAPINPELDPDYDPNKYTLGVVNDTLPRCPFCANEMSSMDARICLNCGYNTRTRARPEVKAVYEVTGGELFLWLLPGILCVVTMIGMLVWYLVFWSMIEDWMADSWFEDEPGPPKTYMIGLSPGAARLYHALLILGAYVPLSRFAYKRLVVDNKPREQKIKGE